MPRQTYRVVYSEIVNYVELIEAVSAEEAYKEFYKKMEEDEYESDTVEIENIEIEPLIKA